MACSDQAKRVISADMLTVSVVIDEEFGLTVTKELQSGSTIRDLKEALAQDDPTGQTRVEDVVLRRLHGAHGASPVNDTTLISAEVTDLILQAADDPSAANDHESGAHDNERDCDIADGQASSDPPPSLQEQVSSSSPPSEEEWLVVHSRVVKRKEPSKEADMLGVAKKDDVLKGTVIQCDGVPWLQTTHSHSQGETECFCMIDGTSVGLGKLLEKRVDISFGDYYVTAGTLFKKPGANPESQKIIKVNKGIGSILHTTGKTWTGSSGGIWVELDASKGEKPGWVLVEGPGFGLSGPCLKLACAADGPPIVLHMPRPTPSAVAEGEDPDIRHFLVFPNTTVAETKAIIGDLFGLKKRQFILCRGKRAIDAEDQTAGNIDNIGPDDILADSAKMGEASFETGMELPYIYNFSS